LGFDRDAQMMMADMYWDISWIFMEHTVVSLRISCPSRGWLVMGKQLWMIETGAFKPRKFGF